MATIMRHKLMHRAYYVDGWEKVRTTCDLQWIDKKHQLLDGNNHPLTCVVCIAFNEDDERVFMAGERWT